VRSTRTEVMITPLCRPLAVTMPLFELFQPVTRLPHVEVGQPLLGIDRHDEVRTECGHGGERVGHVRLVLEPDEGLFADPFGDVAGLPAPE
jgi:hypothetical protein